MFAFTLDPDYESFDRQRLKLSTLTYLNRASLGCFIPVALWFAFLSISVAVAGITWVVDRIDFDRNGVETNAIVVHCEDDSYAKLGNYATFTLSYTAMMDGTPQSMTATASTVPGHYCFPSGSHIAIRYLPAQPERTLFVEPSLAKTLGDDVQFVLAVTAGLVFFTWIAYRSTAAIITYLRATRQRPQLIRDGRLLIGKVTQAKISAGRQSRNVKIAYQFSTPDGRLLKGRQQIRRRGISKSTLPLPGTPVQVLYADDHTYVML